MNRRLEDEIAKLAFGDADPKRTAEIERLAQTDPAVHKALEQYRAMRLGLSAMTPSIEHQLSSERLREEILRRGLKPKQRGFDWRWSAVPLAAAGAFALAAWWPSGSVSTPVLVEAAKQTPPISLTAPTVQPDTVATITPPPQPAPSPIVRSKPSSAKRSTVAKRSQSNPVITVEPDRVATRTVAPPSAAPPMPGSAGGLGAGAFGASVATFGGSTPEKPDSDPIVVIQPVRDANTGAYRATEVASPSNVLIGS